MMTSPGRRYVRFVVTSDLLTGAQLERRVDTPGDRTRTRGEVLRSASPRDVVASVSAWEVQSSLAAEEVVEHHLAQLFGLIAPLRDSLRALAAEGCKSTLRIVQYLQANEYQGYGIPIPPEWIELLGNLGASIDIDQYVEEVQSDAP
jgi:Domain of unknown function (DUF4279)